MNPALRAWPGPSPLLSVGTAAGLRLAFVPSAPASVIVNLVCAHTVVLLEGGRRASGQRALGDRPQRKREAAGLSRASLVDATSHVPSPLIAGGPGVSCLAPRERALEAGAWFPPDSAVYTAIADFACVISLYKS